MDAETLAQLASNLRADESAVPHDLGPYIDAIAIAMHEQGILSAIAEFPLAGLLEGIRGYRIQYEPPDIRASGELENLIGAVLSVWCTTDIRQVQPLRTTSYRLDPSRVKPVWRVRQEQEPLTFTVAAADDTALHQLIGRLEERSVNESSLYVYTAPGRENPVIVGHQGAIVRSPIILPDPLREDVKEWIRGVLWPYRAVELSGYATMHVASREARFRLRISRWVDLSRVRTRPR